MDLGASEGFSPTSRYCNIKAMENALLPSVAFSCPHLGPRWQRFDVPRKSDATSSPVSLGNEHELEKGDAVNG